MRRAWWMAALLSAGCTSSFDPASYVNGLRVLGVKAEPPEVAFGQSTKVQVLAVDPTGSPIFFDWSFCLATPPPAPGAINVDCASLDPGDGGVPLVPIPGDGPSVTTMLPPLMRSNFGTPDGTAGFYVPLRILARDDASTLLTIYPLRIALGLTAPNHNPSITAVSIVSGETDGGDPGTATPLVEGKPLDVTVFDADGNPLGSPTALQLRATLADGAIETFTVPTPTGPEMQMEQVDTSWFATAGTFGEGSSILSGRRYETTWTAKGHLPGPGSIVDVWVVAHDDRGGTDFAHRALRLR